jgi:hypothetical protein
VVPFNSKQATAYELADILAVFLNLYTDRNNWMCDTFIALKKIGLVYCLTKEEQATIYNGFDAPKKVRFKLLSLKENHRHLWKLESPVFYE